MCGTDHAFVNGFMPGLSWPLTPGHEIAGTIAEIGDGVEDFAIGDRVEVGWFGGNCNRCVPCRKGCFMQCQRLQVPSWHYPGGYAESVVVPATALARIPEELTFGEAAPLGCAGVTTFNGLRRTKAKAGDLVAVLGIGGLGHLGVQFARAMGFETVAIARGAARADAARELGAHHYIDSTESDVAAALKDLGGAAVVLATAANAEAMAATVGGLGPQGELVTIGVTPDNLPISPAQLIDAELVGGRASIRDVSRRRGDHALRGAERRETRHPGASAGPGGRGVRGHGHRQGPLPDRAHRLTVSPGPALPRRPGS